MALFHLSYFATITRQREKEYDIESKRISFETENYTHQRLSFHLGIFLQNKIINEREIKI
jgi:hypothetical protein